MAGAPLKRWAAPGRVNLIGEHTDYTGGLVLPVALDLVCEATVSAGDPGRLRVQALDLGEERTWGLEGLARLEPAHDWSDYVAGVAQQVLRLGFEIPAMTLELRSSVPIGSGLSSSASLEVAAALALLDDRPIDKLELARLCHRAENEFVGLPCGIMDQFISVFGEDRAALLIDCRDLSRQAVPLPAGVTFVAVNSMVKHALGDSAYRERVADCAEAVARLGVESLRDATEEMLPALEGRLLARASHVVKENARVREFAAAARAGDVEAMGRAMQASHRSLRDDYEVSCAELDFLVEAALAIPGVLGARMTGGGFGGCTVNLVREDAVDQFRSAIAAAYQERYGRTPEVYPCRPSRGARKIS